MYYKQMDGLRFFCVMGVLFSHIVHPVISKYFLTAIIGVDLFFIISGFLITESLLKLKDKYDFKKAFQTFYMRRILRIFPLYYLYWLIMAVFYFKEYAPTFPWGLLYGINFYIIYFTDKFYLVGHLWSLAVEEQFYLVWPFLMLLALHKNLIKYTRWLIIISLVYIFWNLLADNVYNFNYMHPLGCAVALLSGAIMAIWKHNGDNMLYFMKGKVNLALVIFTLGSLLIGYLCAKEILHEQHKIFLRLLTCLLGFAIMPVIASNNVKGFFGKILENRFVVYIGKISYGVYMYHILVLYVLRPYVEDAYGKIFSGHIFDSGPLRYIRYNPTLFEFPFYALVTILVASVSYYGFEKRFLNLKAKYK